jgi:hypothetical protein
MSPKPHLQIFNDAIDQATQNNAPTFPLFPLLPKELRLKIWHHSLQRQRLIRVLLSPEKIFNTTEPAIQETETVTSPSKSERYRAYVEGYQVLDKLLRVNCEAREAALEFYRVPLPCFLTKGLETSHGIPYEATPGTVYINPEYDFLYITPQSSAEETLVDFFYHMKTTYDPYHIGLLNLALDFNGLNAGDLSQQEFSSLDLNVRTAFVETLAQLQEVFFVSEQSAGRTMDKQSGFVMPEPFFNRSLPILGAAPTFERLHCDPRPISEDLRHVFVDFLDQRLVLQLWQQLLKKFSVVPTRITYRYCLFFSPAGKGQRVYDHLSAERWLQWEDDLWTGALAEKALEKSQGGENQGSFFSWAFGGIWKKKKKTIPVSLIGGRSEKYKNEDLTKAARPAIGFWLFPVEVLDFEEAREGPHHLFNMSGHWPELALSSLP